MPFVALALSNSDSRFPSNVLRRVWKTRDFSVTHRNKSGTVRSGDHGSHGMPPNREGKRPGKMFRSIFVEVLASGIWQPFWRNGTFRMYERAFQDTESCQACPDDVRRLLLRFRVVRFQRCEVRWRWNVSHHNVTLEELRRDSVLLGGSS